MCEKQLDEEKDGNKEVSKDYVCLCVHVCLRERESNRETERTNCVCELCNRKRETEGKGIKEACEDRESRRLLCVSVSSCLCVCFDRCVWLMHTIFFSI